MSIYVKILLSIICAVVLLFGCILGILYAIFMFITGLMGRIIQ